MFLKKPSHWKGFNEAATDQSRKCRQPDRRGPPRQASMRPRLISRGNWPTHSPSVTSMTRFNEAATDQSRKLR